MQWFAENPIGFPFMRWYRNLNFLYNMKKVTIVFDFESQSLDVSVNDARECVTSVSTCRRLPAPRLQITPKHRSQPRRVGLPYEDSRQYGISAEEASRPRL